MGKTLSIVFTAAASFGAGLVAGLLFSPYSGEENRRRLAAQVKAQTANLEAKVKELESTMESLEKQIVESGRDLKVRVKGAASKAFEQYVPSVPDDDNSWDLERSDIASDLPRMPKV
jgi:gas vesicle protein